MARFSVPRARSRWGTPNTAGVSIPSEVTFDRVGYAIGEARILSDISLTAQSGKVTCLLGPSGSGKTTLLRIAAGMVRQSEGRVLQDGREIAGDTVFKPPEKRGIGLVFQDYALFPHLDVHSNVTFGLSHLSAKDRTAHAHKMLQRVGMEDRAGDFPHQLSGGEQQRVALARALAPRPGVLLMDEPFSGLDSRLRDQVREETLGILLETRATSIVVTHDPEEALGMGHMIALLSDGRLQQAGTGRDLFYRPASLFVAGFFSELNTFEAIANRGICATPLGHIPAPDIADGKRVTVAVRSSAIDVAPLIEGGQITAPVGEAGTVGRILDAQFGGTYVALRIGLADTEEPLRVRISANLQQLDALMAGSHVIVTPQLEGAFVF